MEQEIQCSIFQWKSFTTIIAHYSPAEGNNEAGDHLNRLAATVKEVPKHDMLVVTGDFNTHIGRDVVKYSFHESSSSNGKLVHDFVEEAGLFIINIPFQKKLKNLWTFISDMSGTKSQIDYAMNNRKWKNLIHNCQSCNYFRSMGLDHRI